MVDSWYNFIMDKQDCILLWTSKIVLIILCDTVLPLGLTIFVIRNIPQKVKIASIEPRIFLDHAAVRILCQMKEDLIMNLFGG